MRLQPARLRAVRVSGSSHRQPRTSIAAIAALPGLCESTETVENGTVGALSDSGARMSPSGSQSSSQGVSRVSWAIR